MPVVVAVISTRKKMRREQPPKNQTHGINGIEAAASYSKKGALHDGIIHISLVLQKQAHN
jgi:hypothetical protein